MFDALHDQPADKILMLIAAYRDDPRVDKIDLSVGVYKNAKSAAIVWSWTGRIAPQGQPLQVLRGRSLVYFTLTPEGWRISADMWQAAP